MKLKPLLLACLTACVPLYAQVYQESGSLVIIEIENTTSPLRQWDALTSIDRP